MIRAYLRILSELYEHDFDTTRFFLLTNSTKKKHFHYCFVNVGCNLERILLPIFALPQAISSMGTKLIYVVHNFNSKRCVHFKILLSTELFAIGKYFNRNDVVNGITWYLWIRPSRVEHSINFWNIRHLRNILFVAYEEMVDLQTIKMISEFLECKHTDEWLMQ